MAIIKVQPHRINANRLNLVYADPLLSGLEHLLPRPVTPHLSRRREHAQIFTRQLIATAIIECYFKHPGLPVQSQLGWFGLVTHSFSARVNPRVTLHAHFQLTR
jgi:hypothetical protein